MNLNIFEPPPEQQKEKPKDRCRNCVNIYKHQYNDTKYCRKQPGKRTSYGHKKIKANDPACPMFEKR